MTVTVQQGAVNPTNQTIPGLAVGIIAPQIQQLNGLPTNIMGVVGSASYGPANTPIPWQDYASFSAAFGPTMPRAGDLGTAVSIGIQQGVNAGYAVRVTDHSDTAATAQFGISGGNYAVMLSAKYTGSAGNKFTATIATSKYAGAVQLVLYNGIGQTEIFDNLPTASPAAFWTAVAAAINSGNTSQRPRSQYFIATLGTNITAAIPAAGGTPLALTGGTDGVGSLTSASYIGADGTATARTGMYALRGTGCSAAVLCDVAEVFAFPGGGSSPTVTTDVWAAQATFGLSERIYMISATAAGDVPSNWLGFNAPGIAGAGNYGLKCMFGDWVTWQDNVNNQKSTVKSMA